MVQLEEVFARPLGVLPVELETNLTLCASNCPSAPDELETAALILRAHPLGHNYGDSARYDLLDFFADKPTYRRLGLLLFSSIFHPNPLTTLHLRHPDTGVKKIVIRREVTEPSAPGASELVMIPASFGYWPEPARGRHPLQHGERVRREADLPWMELTNEHLMCVSDEEFAHRDVVHGFGDPVRTATLAALWLDIGLPGTSGTEFHLEGPSGDQSVAVGSAEARFWVGYEYAL